MARPGPLESQLKTLSAPARFALSYQLIACEINVLELVAAPSMRAPRTSSSWYPEEGYTFLREGRVDVKVANDELAARPKS